MEKVNITTAYTNDKKILYYLDHPSSDEAIVLNSDELFELYKYLDRLCKPTIATEECEEESPKPQLIIHETDCHGCGNVVYNGQVLSYSYDDGCFGDARATVEELIKIGFIDPNRVVVFKDDEIYDHLDIK